MDGASVILIAGPTASGKSAAALALAKKLDGEIVNADAMQVYSDLRILTARPPTQEEAAIPHHLYGVLDGAERCSAGRWARLASETIRDILARGRPSIVVGGTGLYFRALEDGLSPIPEIPAAVRERAGERIKELGPAAFRAEVVARDPAMARLPEGDSQRLLRAWEVFEATGKPLSHFQTLPRTPLIESVASRIVIEPPRDVLYARCDARATAMLAEGADRVWGSAVKQTLKRRRPGFSETAYGFRSFSDLLEEAEERGLLDMDMDERSGGYVIRSVKRDE